MVGLDNSGPILSLCTTDTLTDKYLTQMVRGEIPNTLPQITAELMVDSGLLICK